MSQLILIVALSLGMAAVSFHSKSEANELNCAVVIEIAGGNEAQRLEASLLINRAIEAMEIGQFISISSGSYPLYLNSSAEEIALYLERLRQMENASFQRTNGYALVQARVPKLEIIFSFENALDRYFGYNTAHEIVGKLIEEGRLSEDYLSAPKAEIRYVGHCK